MTPMCSVDLAAVVSNSRYTLPEPECDPMFDESVPLLRNRAKQGLVRTLRHENRRIFTGETLDITVHLAYALLLKVIGYTLDLFWRPRQLYSA